MGYYINNNMLKEKTYVFDKIGTNITLSKCGGSVLPEIESSIVDLTDLKKDPIAYGLNNGIILTIMAFMAEGMEDIVDHPKFEECVSQALARVPSLSASLENNDSN